MTQKTYYVTTPIYYVNGHPHVGAALTTVACDVLARYHRLRGREAFLLTGTDENATKVQEAAQQAGVDTMAFVDGLSEEFKKCWDALHVHYNDYIRTTEPRHTRVVQEFFRRLLERGFVYLDTYEGWYSVSDETFFRDSEVKDGVAVESGKPVQRVREENYFFKLSAFQNRLLAHIEQNESFLQPDFRRNEVIGFINEGLRDMCLTRPNRGWGIPFPGDESKVIYVWFDALINYLTETGWPDNPDWERLWPADLHFMGKEIFVRFHATLWPAMLMALDLPLPKQVFAHGWWTVQGAKGGKTGASLPHPIRFIRLLAQRTGADEAICADALRYLLCREMNFGQDTEFSVENFLRRFNADLANDLGNLLNRTINMAGRYFEGKVPATSSHDAEVAALATEVLSEYAGAMEVHRLNGALEAVWKLVARMNKYIDERAPWTLHKAAAAGDAQAAEALAVTIYSCLEASRIACGLLAPFMPVAADAIRKQLGLTRPSEDLRWDDLVWGRLPAGSLLGKPMPIFPRIQDLTADDDTLFALGSANPENAAAPIATTEQEKTKTVTATNETVPAGTPVTPAPVASAPAEITIDDFMKVELRIGDVLEAEPVPNTDKLLRLTVQVGDETRTILSGIAEYYKPEELVGRQVVVVVNLAPRKMRGILSQGMLLAADVNGAAVLLQPDAKTSSGARVR